jgi:uncharacterized protein YuzE
MLNLKFDYDKDNDVLYISVGEPRPSYGYEEVEGIIIRRDFETHELTGVTILYLSKRLENLNELSRYLPFDFDIDIKKELKITN